MERVVLFWVFVGFFVITGIVSLLAIIGVLKTDDRFRKWAITGFVTGVAGAVFGLFKVVFLAELPIFIALIAPQQEGQSGLNLVRGEYQLFSRPEWRQIEITQDPGGWRAKLPQRVLGEAVELRFKDDAGRWWRVPSFDPTYNRQGLVKMSAPAGVTRLPSGPGNPIEKALRTVTQPAFADERQTLSLVADTQSLTFDNYARSIGSRSGSTYYQWRVFLNEPRSILDKVMEVDYLLHPSFPEPFQVRKDANDNFSLEMTGWGQFTIFITVRFKDGRVEKTTYFLDLSKGWPRQ
jgi:hypothetical protein